MAKAIGGTARRGKGQAKGRGVDPTALAEVQALLGDRPRRRDLLIECLHILHDRQGHLSAPHLVALARELGVAQVEVFEVASFYHHFDVVKEGEAAPPALTVRVCDSVGCALFGAEELIARLERGIGGEVRVQRVPCVGRCAEAPVAVVGRFPIGQADLAKVETAIANRQTEDAPPTGARDFAAYIADGGYAMLRGCLAGEPAAESIIATLEASKLRGLGGAGFPVGRKWRIVRGHPGPRLMAVNIDEGEPGTFKDRHYLERDPHRFLEGMLIAAHVVGVEAIYLYLRDEYAGCRALLERELATLRRRADWPMPTIELRRGAGVYVCGEESAMLESIEGKRGMPRLRPPYVAEVGLFGRPTLVHNFESLYWVRTILENGPQWFTAQGRRGRSGLRSFSVSGRVAKPGVHLAPAGITVRELIDEHCGGMLPGHRFYGYLPGGASGGILPATLGDLPLDFDTLNPHGCFIGSAAVIVLSDQDRARDAALNAMRFFAHESCGRCTPCRVGTAKAARLMEAKVWDQPLLEELAAVMMDTSICGLGQAAPNPMLCVMRYFSDEVSHGGES